MNLSLNLAHSVDFKRTITAVKNASFLPMPSANPHFLVFVRPFSRAQKKKKIRFLHNEKMPSFFSVSKGDFSEYGRRRPDDDTKHKEILVKKMPNKIEK